MEYILLVQQLDSFDHLLPDLQDSLQGQPFALLSKEVLETAAEEVHKHDVVLPFGGDCIYLGVGMGTLGIPLAGPNELRYLYILAS